jgi:molecular chaperone DnaK
VPAYFNDAQRQATKDAGKIAGLEVLRIINEPTAAALAYGYGRGKRERIAVYDFGGGTFDITVLELRDQVFEVLATAGDTYLGGDDFDQRLAQQMVSMFNEEHHYDLSSDLVALQRLKAASERVKIELSERDRVDVTVKERIPGKAEPAETSFSVNRSQFNERCGDIIQRTFTVCDEALRLSGMSPSLIDHLVLVGGSTRIPLVRDMVTRYFQTRPEADIDVHQVVAMGAAIFAAGLDQQFYGRSTSYETDKTTRIEALLIDVTPHSLGIETVGEHMDIIIDRNTAIPTESTRRFTTSNDYQTEVRIQVYEGEDRTTHANTKLGELVLKGLPAVQRGEVEIDVTFKINTDGMLDVTAQDPSTGRRQESSLSIAGGLSDAEIARLKGDRSIV